ncbi:MAG: penicillin acylase family protein [Ignavibacteria bacterium]|nr:penicillin acylase family protein [Ignavibacteria bacterium]
MRSEDHPWFDDVTTYVKENRNDIIRKSLKMSVEYLSSLYESSDPQTWKWGNIHKLNFTHIFSSQKALEKAFNIGEFQMHGDQTTAANNEYSFRKVIERNDFSVKVGASMRMIVNLSDIDHPLTINSTGQSGQPLHPNYKDQSRKWYYGEFKRCLMNENEMISANYSLLTLIP